ncbi:MAG: alpha/beta fold hydrolase [Alphaproteobacteria bacterium]|nr:alpha/beta fold hydrolase [Alphaproteobacteria bacterium]
MFLGGFKSDMKGTKAVFLENFCKERGQAFLRFDYSGHGESGGSFEDGTIGQWFQDAKEIIQHVIGEKEAVIVGSSMGGWIALLYLLSDDINVRGVIGIAAAPDFTEDFLAQLNDEQRAVMKKTGRLELPNDYSEEPYVFTQALIEDGAHRALLHQIYNIKCPIILLQGKLDPDVPWQKAEKIKECFKSSRIEIHYIENGDHRLSREEDLRLLAECVDVLSDNR